MEKSDSADKLIHCCLIQELNDAKCWATKAILVQDGLVGQRKFHRHHLLCRWWKEYSDRKNDEEDEHVADSLLYDRSHLPRAAPPPESVFQERQRAQQSVNVEFASKGQ